MLYVLGTVISLVSFVLMGFSAQGGTRHDVSLDNAYPHAGVKDLRGARAASRSAVACLLCPPVAWVVFHLAGVDVALDSPFVAAGVSVALMSLASVMVALVVNHNLPGTNLFLEESAYTAGERRVMAWVVAVGNAAMWVVLSAVAGG